MFGPSVTIDAHYPILEEDIPWRQLEEINITSSSVLNSVEFPNMYPKIYGLSGNKYDDYLTEFLNQSQYLEPDISKLISKNLHQLF